MYRSSSRWKKTCCSCLCFQTFLWIYVLSQNINPLFLSICFGSKNNHCNNNSTSLDGRQEIHCRERFTTMITTVVVRPIHASEAAESLWKWIVCQDKDWVYEAWSMYESFMICSELHWWVQNEIVLLEENGRHAVGNMGRISYSLWWREGEQIQDWLGFFGGRICFGKKNMFWRRIQYLRCNCCKYKVQPNSRWIRF